MNIAHVGLMTPVMSFADIQSTIRTSLASWNRAITADAGHRVSVRVSQLALRDPQMTASNLRGMLGEYELRLGGFSAVNISGGSKDRVHEPDWRTEERLGAVFAAANLAAEIADPDEEFSITTSALSHRSWLDATMPGNWAALTLNVIRIVQHLATIRERTGVTIHLDLEAEPSSLLRTPADIVRFWQDWLLVRGAAMLSDRMAVLDDTAATTVARHVRLALDTAHMAVMWADPAASIAQLVDTGVRIGRVQASAALGCIVPADHHERSVLAEYLRSLLHPTLLQQVVAASGEEFADLPDAIGAIDNAIGQRWRIHTHAPLLADTYGVFTSTRADTAAWLREIAARQLDVGMVELRSANWDVVESSDDTAALIAREADWVRAQLQ